MNQFTELSLFTGAGGGLLASLLHGWRTIGYVEWNEYCQKLIAQRCADGILPTAPIFGDIRTFTSEGYAVKYRGMVDVLTAGFPCQPFSLAGKQAGEFDPRNMWPATLECIRVVRPRFALLENNPGLLSNEYIRRIFGQLAEVGYNARWACLSAKDQGAPIERERVFIACSDSFNGQERVGVVKNGQTEIFKSPDRKCPEFWLQTPSGDIGMGNGVADYMDRVTAIGNGQVPAVARRAWEVLT